MGSTRGESSIADQLIEHVSAAIRSALSDARASGHMEGMFAVLKRHGQPNEWATAAAKEVIDESAGMALGALHSAYEGPRFWTVETLAAVIAKHDPRTVPAEPIRYAYRLECECCGHVVEGKGETFDRTTHEIPGPCPQPGCEGRMSGTIEWTERVG